MLALSDPLHGLGPHRSFYGHCRRPPKYVFVLSISNGGLDTDTVQPAAGLDTIDSDMEEGEELETVETGKPCHGFDGGALLDSRG